MSSKIIGAENDFFSKMVAESIKYVKTGDKYPIKAINIVKNGYYQSNYSLKVINIVKMVTIKVINPLKLSI